MDINHLHAFITVAHTRNLTHAAEKLFLSQPAVSAQIKAIETAVGTPLFKRNSNGMTLTRAGTALLPEAEALLQHKHKLEQFAKTLPEHYVQEAQLGIIHPLGSTQVSSLARTVMENRPEVQLHIQYGMSGEILTRVQAKKLHGGLFLGHLNQSNLQIRFLENIDYTLICPAQDEETLRRNLPQSLNGCTWIEMSPVSGSRKALQQLWQQHGISPKKHIICDYPQAIIELCASGAGLALVPKHIAQAAQKQGKTISLIHEFDIPLPLNFIYLNEYSSDPSLQLLLHAVMKTWNISF